MEYFGDLIAVNGEDIGTFVKDTHSVNNARANVQRSFISNNATQVLKSMCFELKDRELCNDFPDELALFGINVDQISIMRKNRYDKK